MKKNIVCILLLYSSFSIYAQSKSASVYVPPITGTGSRSEDNLLFYNQLIAEVRYQHFNLAKTKNDADFSLIGTLSDHPDNAPSGNRQYALHLVLMDNKTNKSRSDGDLVYETPEDIKGLLPNLAYTILYTIPEGAGKNKWRNKWLYAGGSAFWTPRLYTSESVSANLANFGGGIFLEYHFLNFLSFEAGVEIAPDLTKVVAKDQESYSNLLLEIPVLVKFVIKPGDYFVLEPYGGVHFNIPLDKTTSPPLVSWLAGFQYGVKAGPGVLFIDPRFSMDIGESSLPDAGDLSFQRYIIHLGIGYKLGFSTKR